MSVSIRFRFGTFNIGQGYSDYSGMLSNDEKEYRLLSKEMEQAVKDIQSGYQADKIDDKTREEIASKAKDRVLKNRKVEEIAAARLAEQCDVMALQEVVRLDRPFIQTLREKGFEIYYYDKAGTPFSTALAIRKDLFESVKNISIPSQSGEKSQNGQRTPIYGQEMAAVVAKVKNMATEIAFSSLHSWGFQLFSPNDTNRRYSENDLKQMNYGIAYTKEALNLLKEKPITVFAGDMNNNPENQPKQFNLIKNAGFDVLEPDQDTNINMYDPSYSDRKIDFIYVSKRPFIQRVWSAIKSVFVSTTHVRPTSAKVLESFTYTKQGNCSDHKPVVTTVEVTTAPSLISRVHTFFSCLRKPKTQ